MGFDLRPTAEQQLLRETIHGFAEDVLRPAARGAESARTTGPEIARAIHDLGVSAPVAGDYGGGGMLDAVTYCIVAEELAWGNPGIAWSALGSGLAAIVLGIAGGEAQKRRYLPGFCAGEPLPSFVAIGEKVAAGDLEALETTVESGVLTGEKYGVLNAERSPFGVVVGRRAEGIVAGVVEGTSYEILGPEDKMGLEAAPTSVGPVRRPLRRAGLRRGSRPSGAVGEARHGGGGVGVRQGVARVCVGVRRGPTGIRQADRCVSGGVFQDRRHGDRGGVGAHGTVARRVDARSWGGYAGRHRRGQRAGVSGRDPVW